MRLYELKQKEVINICSCRLLGYISDLEFDCQSGRIESLIIPGPGRICSILGREYEYHIPWKCVVQIGRDIILVEIEEEKYKKKCG